MAWTPSTLTTPGMDTRRCAPAGQPRRPTARRRRRAAARRSRAGRRAWGWSRRARSGCCEPCRRPSRTSAPARRAAPGVRLLVGRVECPCRALCKRGRARAAPDGRPAQAASRQRLSACLGRVVALRARGNVVTAGASRTSACSKLCGDRCIAICAAAAALSTRARTHPALSTASGARRTRCTMQKVPRGTSRPPMRTSACACRNRMGSTDSRRWLSCARAHGFCASARPRAVRRQHTAGAAWRGWLARRAMRRTRLQGLH